MRYFIEGTRWPFEVAEDGEHGVGGLAGMKKLGMHAIVLWMNQQLQTSMDINHVVAPRENSTEREGLCKKHVCLTEVRDLP
jgi:hypothetical protein